MRGTQAAAVLLASIMTPDAPHLRAMGDDGEHIYRCFQANR